MKWAVLILAAAPLFAGDPFEAYRRSVDEKLSAMIAAPAEPAENHEPSEAAPATPAPTATPFPRFETWRPMVERILQEEGLPKELAAVVLVESGGRPDALSPKQARGLWQFMPATARQYGLRVGPERDERVDPASATRAAARFLRDLYRRFGDWPLALAAYNAGQQAVANALERAGASTFAAVGGLLPRETRRYVPAVLSAMRLIAPFQSASTAAAPRPSRWTYAPFAATF